jgi:hypothetical protein
LYIREWQEDSAPYFMENVNGRDEDKEEDD